MTNQGGIEFPSFGFTTATTVGGTSASSALIGQIYLRLLATSYSLARWRIPQRINRTVVSMGPKVDVDPSAVNPFRR